MLKNYRLIATVLVFAASGFGAIAQTDETDNFKEVLLNGKPAKLNLITGEITYANGEIATSRAARKLKDSLLDSRTEIKTNLIKDMEDTSGSNDNGLEVTETDQTTSEAVPTLELIEGDSVAESTEVDSMFPQEKSIESESNSEDNSEGPESFESDFHMVKEGEHLYLLSKRYNTTLRELMLGNNLQTTVIQPGQTLRVRNFDFSESKITWTVNRGDTLYGIAKQNNTTIEELKELNGLTTSLIKVGQKLQVNQNSTLTKK